MASFSRFRFETVDADRYRDVADILARGFGLKNDPEQVRRKLDTGYTTVAGLSQLAYHRGLPIGYLGLVPILVSGSRGRVLGALTCDHMTLPDYRGCGVHRELLRRAKDLSRARGVKFLASMPAEEASRVSRRLGWCFDSCLSMVVLPTHRRLGAVLRRLRLGWFHRRWVSAALKGLRAARKIDNPLRHEDWVHIPYDDDYLDYRRFDPNEILSHRQTRAWVKTGEHLIVGAIEGPGQLAMIERLYELARLGGLRSLVVYAAADSQLEANLARRYGVVPAWNLGTIDLGSGLDLARLRLNGADYDTF